MTWTTTDSNPEPTGRYWILRGLYYDKPPFTTPNALNFDDEWTRFRDNAYDVLTTKRKINLSANEAWEMIGKALTDPHDSEDEFKSTLELLLKEILDGDGAEEIDTPFEGCTRALVPLVSINDLVKKEHQNAKEIINVPSSTLELPHTAGNKKKSIADHTCFVEESEQNHLSALVVFKTDKTTCKQFSDYIERLQLDDPDRGGPIAQILANCLQSVLPELIQNGIRPEFVPWVVLACSSTTPSPNDDDDESQDQKRTKSARPCRFVFGSLWLPEVCGAMPYYSIDEIGFFGDENNSAKLAMAAYLRVMNFGLENLSVCRTRSPEMKSDKLLSGRQVCIGSIPVEHIKVIGTPYRSKHIPPSQDPRSINSIHISQGELLSGEIDWQLVQDYAKKRRDSDSTKLAVHFHTDPKTLRSASILCKVSCRIFREMLIDPIDAYNSMERVLTKLSKDDVPYIFEVLLAVYAPSQGSLITVMRDLRQENYASFQPMNIGKTKLLWDMFTGLVINALLPLAARCRVVFSDLRMGWDITCNILHRAENNQLRLIDFESLSNELNCPTQKNAFHVEYDRHGKFEYEKSRIKYVWWQIVLVAYCWSNEISYKNFSAPETMRHLINEFTADKWSRLCRMDGIDRVDFPALQTIANKKPSDVSVEDVTNTLHWLGPLFPSSKQESNEHC